MLKLLFSCEACGLVKREAYVRYRRKGEDISAWMQEVGHQVSTFHDLATPADCRPKVISELYIPTDDSAAGIGYPPNSLALWGENPKP